jgi:hypothetical protein
MKMKGNYTERTSAENIQLEVLDLTLIKLVYVPEDMKILHKNRKSLTPSNKKILEDFPSWEHGSSSAEKRVVC